MIDWIKNFLEKVNYASISNEDFRLILENSKEIAWHKMGLDKIVFCPVNSDYVIKVPRDKRYRDNIEAFFKEQEIYERAKKNGLEKFFLKNEIVYSVKDTFYVGYMIPISIQKKVTLVSENREDIERRGMFLLEEYTSLLPFLSSREWTTKTYELFLERGYVQHMFFDEIKFIYFCEDNCIEDFHFGNIGIENNNFVMIDYAL